MAYGGVDGQSRGSASLMAPVTALFAMVGSAIAMFISSPPAFAAAPSGGSCVAATQDAQVHFITDFSAGSPDGGAISGLTISGLDSSACDGLPVTVVISGNAAGGSGPASMLLSTLDSTLDPCTGSSVGSPLKIVGGAITLYGCATLHDPSGAAYASIHDATQVAVTVAGATIPVAVGGVATTTTPTSVTTSSSSSGAGVAGVSTSRQRPGGSTAAVPGGNGHEGRSENHGLASTGTDIALLTVVGVLLVLFGVLLMRRRSSEHGH